MTLQKAQCPKCGHRVIQATMKAYSKLRLCVECYAGIKIENERTGRKKRVRPIARREPVVMNKYGTAEIVQKKDGKAVISKEKLSDIEVAKIVSGEKTASKKTKKQAVVTEEDYRQED